MNSPIKLLLYIVLVIVACVSGVFASKNFKAMMNRSSTTAVDEDEQKARAADAVAEQAATNAIPLTQGATNATPSTTTNNESIPPQDGTTNTAPAVASTPTNPPPAQEATDLKPKKDDDVITALGSRGAREKEKKSGIGLWSGVFVLSIIGLGIMLALDISNFFGNRALKVIYNDEGEGIANPDYEAAENEWTKGNFLESIRLMRDYLNRNPREQYVALRIAEIYEKDLNNPLAAALEYEEVLTKKLQPERWGWAAIHLCNLYFHIDQEQKAFALLRRIVTEYPDIPAAEKARKRLEQIDGAPAEPAIPSPTQSAVRVVQAPTSPPPPASNLPPGFRPKK